MLNKDKKQYISVAELAEMLGISRVAVFKKIQKGQIVAEKTGRAYVIRISDIEGLLHGKDEFLTEEKKENIDNAVEKVVQEYGDTLKLLGKE